MPKSVDRRKAVLGVPVLLMGLSFSAAAQDCVPPPSGLLSWWTADGTADDSAGSSDGVMENGAVFVPGKVGQAFGFDGVDDFVRVPGLFGGIPELTIEAWISTAAVQSSFQSIVSSPAPGEFVHFQTQQGAGAPGNIAVYTDTGPFTGILLAPIPQLPTGDWRHVAVTIKSGDTRVYLNGSVLDLDPEMFSLVEPTTDLRIGGTLPLGGRFFNGAIDEVAIYDRALTEDEILDIYEAGSAGKCKTATVAIDVRPGSDTNPVNPRSRGRIPVAILSGGSFDATSVVEATVRFGASGTEAAAVHATVTDVDQDLDLDLLLLFEVQDTGIECGDVEAILTGETAGGLSIRGSDSIQTIGCR